MVEHVLEELGVTLGGHALVLCRGEVAIVVANKDGHASGNRRVNLVGGLAPLLHGVVEKDVLIDVVGDLGELGVVLLAQLHDGDLLVLTEGRHELLVERLSPLVAKGELERSVVEGDRHERAVDIGQNLVLVASPLSEAREVLVHAVVHGVVDVWTVLVHQDARIIHVVVGIAANVVASLDDGNLHAARLGKAACADRTCVACAHDDGVVCIGIEARRQSVCDSHESPSQAPRKAPIPPTAQGGTSDGAHDTHASRLNLGVDSNTRSYNGCGPL